MKKSRFWRLLLRKCPAGFPPHPTLPRLQDRHPLPQGGEGCVSVVFALGSQPSYPGLCGKTQPFRSVRLKEGTNKAFVFGGLPNGRKLSAQPAAERRFFLPLSLIPLLLAVCCLLPTAHNLFAAGTRYEVREVKPHVFVWIPEDIVEIDGDPRYSRAGTAGFIITEEGAVVVNTTNSPFHAREVLYEIRHRTEQPVKKVIDTNWTGDQMLGNEVFVDLQSAIISTSVAESALRQYKRELAQRTASDKRLEARLRGFHVRLPDRTFDRELRLVLGGKEIRVLSLGAGEASGDAVVYLPTEKVLFLGDLFQNNYFPIPDSRHIRRWIEVLREVEGFDAEVYVPGHGEPAGKKEVSQFRQFLEWLANEVQNRAREGKTLEQIRGELALSQKYPWRAPELASDLVAAVYQQLTGKQPEVMTPTAGITAPGWSN